MKFFKNNSYDIVKLFVNQMGIAIFSLVLYTAVDAGFTNNSGLKLSLKVSLSVFSTLFYFALLYTVAWDFGAKDRVKIDSGKHEIPRLQGVYLALSANAINFLLAAISVASIALYMTTSAEWLYTTFGISNLFMRFILSAYLGMIQGMTSSLSGNIDFLYESIAYFAAPALSVAVTTFGYYMGCANKRLFSPSKPSSGK